MKKNNISISATVSEMAEDINDFKINVPIAKGVDVEKLVSKDKNPMFVTLEVAHEGVSGNHRRYSKEVIKSIADQINKNKPEAYEGHVKSEDRGTSRPKPVTLWLGAITKVVKGKLRVFAKGYVLPYAKELQQYLSAAKASSKKVAVSVYGQAKAAWDNIDKVYNLSAFDLESVDWARPGGEGLPGLGYLELASEMQDDDIIKRENIIKDLKIGELKEFNPSLVSEMRETNRKDLEDNITRRIKRDLDSKTQIVSEQLGVKDSEKAVEIISEMKEELKNLRRSESEHIINNALTNKISNKIARDIIHSLIISEMNNNFTKDNALEVSLKVLKSDEAKAIIREMTSVTRVPTPVQNNKNKETGRRFTVIN